MQGSWRNKGCRRCGLQVSHLQALWLAVRVGCKGQATAENAGDARVLAQQRLQVGNLQAGCESCKGQATAENAGDGNLQALWLAGW